MSTVSVKKVSSYDSDLIYRAVSEHFEALNVARDIRPGLKILIKPNLLTARKPELAVTTHHELVAAVIKTLKELGADDITVADSSGGLYLKDHMRSVYSAAGYMRGDIADHLNYDFGFGTRQCPPDFTVHSFNLINPVLNADYIINLPKLKTHAMTTISAGVKNLFGTIPGLQKPDMHRRYPELSDFCRMLTELAVTVKPDLTIMDAVDSMEGNGPGGGTVKHTGVTLASRDVFALDALAARFMGLDPDTVPHLVAGKEHGFFPGDITLTGDELSPADPPFILPDAVKSPSFTDHIPTFLRKPAAFILDTLVRSYPSVDKLRCVGCGRCAESCPQKIIKIENGKASMPKKGCISCFCCQEMCPVHAISAKRTLKL